MIRYLMATTALVAVLSSVQAIAADLDVRPYLLNPSLGQPPVAAPPPPAPQVSAPPAPTAEQRKPVPKPVSHAVAPTGPAHARLQSNRAAPRKAPAALSLTAQAVQPEQRPVSSEGEGGSALGMLIFGALTTAFGMLVLPALIRALDQLLERPWGSHGADFGDAPTGGFSLDDLLEPATDPAGYRSETEALRAMKEALDAELASARAQMEQARTQAEAMEGAKEEQP